MGSDEGSASLQKGMPRHSCFKYNTACTVFHLELVRDLVKDLEKVIVKIDKNAENLTCKKSIKRMSGIF